VGDLQRHWLSERLLALGVLLLFGLSGWPAQAQTKERPASAQVVVLGEGTVRVVPDLAEIRSGVTNTAKTVKEATQANSRTMSSIMTALTEAGIAQKDIQTARFSIEPVYAAQDQRADNKIIGYRASNQIIARIRAIDKLGDILDRLIVAGANEVWNVDFRVSDSAKAFDEARELAIADARHKAEVYARAAGIVLGRVVTIEEQGGGAGVPMMRSSALAAAAAPVPISAGENTVRAFVTVGFDLGQ
jgi:uncharacterized protein YggE